MLHVSWAAPGFNDETFSTKFGGVGAPPDRPAHIAKEMRSFGPIFVWESGHYYALTLNRDKTLSELSFFFKLFSKKFLARSYNGHFFFCTAILIISCSPRKYRRSMPNPHEITDLLIAWNEGHEESLDLLMPLVERELRKIAGAFMRREDANHTLQTDALVNEAYLKLIDQRQVSWQNRAHFFALAATIMRRVLIDHAKSNGRYKRGGDVVHVDIADVAVAVPEVDEDLIALDEALTRLAKFDLVKSRIVEMRHFGGLSVEETASVLDIAPITVMKHWSLAKAWLKREIRGR